MRTFTAVLSCGLFFTLFAASCERVKKNETAPGPSAQDLFLGKTGAPSTEGPGLIKAQGVFVPTQRVLIKSEFAGRIQELSVKEGQLIAKGDPLLKFDEEELPQVLENQRAQLRAAEDELESNTLWAREVASEESAPEMEETENAQAGMSTQAPQEYEPAPSRVPPSGYWVPVPGLPEDAGGVWPRTGRNYAAMSLPQDPRDAGGIWPAYGRREMSPREESYPAARMGNLAQVNRSRVRPPAVTPISPPVEEEITETEEFPASQAQNAWETESLLSLDRARVDRIRAEVAITERQLARRSLFSPIGGRVEKVDVKEDGQVDPEAPLVEIIRVDPLDLILKIPKKQVVKLEKGQEVSVRLANQPQELFDGEISFIGAQLDADRERVEVRVRVANPDFQIKPGMEGIAEIPLEKPAASRG